MKKIKLTIKRLINQEIINNMNKIFYNITINFLSLFGVYAFFSISKISNKIFIEVDKYKIIIILILATIIAFLQYKKQNKSNLKF